MKHSIILLLIIWAPLCFSDEASTLRFAKIISDHMVLQQEKPITIWGWAQPNAEVEVHLQRSEKRSIDDGNDSTEYAVRMAYMEQHPPPFPRQSRKTKANSTGAWSVNFDSGKASFQPTEIIATSGEQTIRVEDVLIGEVWICAGQSNMGWGNFNRKDREVKSADFPGMRYIAWNDSWYKPREDVKNNIQWQACTPETAPKFSAVPYLFGTFLHRYLKVPVGVINVARGGTLGQTWCTREELDRIGGTMMDTVLADFDEECAVWDDPKQVELLMQAWEKECEQKKKEHAAKVKASEAEGKKPPRLRLPKQPGDARAGWSPPAGLFNATIMPIRHLAPRGVLYYQGENNNFMRWTRYEKTFPKVPVSFRKTFGDDTLPFGCILQPGWGTFGVAPEIATVADGYAMIRDIQHRALKDDPHAGLIATYPSGNSYIHPGEKWPVAEYASLWALANVYGEPIVHRGNRYTHHEVEDDKLFLYFDQDPVVHERWKHIENNASWQVMPQPYQGNAPREGFIIAGADQRWYPAAAREVRRNGVWSMELRSDFVDTPVAARYGWANWPTGNLVGRERIPIPTFRTDDWPLVEGMNYNEEVKQRTSEDIKQRKAKGEQQALERTFRQAQIDLVRAEDEWLKGKATERIENKIARLEALLEEFESDSWLERQLNEYDPAFKSKLESLQRHIEALRRKSD